MTALDYPSEPALDVREHLLLLHQLLGFLDQLEVSTPQRYEFELGVVNLEARYQFNADPISQQVSLSTLCREGSALLFDALGYYALINPDPLLSSNEPLPFAEERALLSHLNSLHLPDEQRLKDHINLETE